jgi:ribose 5-phosphate isomerase B
MTIALATDHAGFEQLKELQKWLESEGHSCRNYGPTQLNPDDDYPDFVFPAARAVAAGEFDKGIIFGRSGEGEAIAANRVKGVRCSVFYGPAVTRKVIDAQGHTSNNPYEIVKLSRQHNDANMLSLAASFVTLEDMKQVIKLWLETPFSDDERHKRRNAKLDSE